MVGKLDNLWQKIAPGNPKAARKLQVGTSVMDQLEVALSLDLLLS